VIWDESDALGAVADRMEIDAPLAFVVERL
jgi:hypothetical protein